MNATTDLELRIRRQQDGNYSADLHLHQRESATVAELASQAPAALDTQALLALRLDPAAYGHSLSAMLFAAPELRQAWAQARAYADAQAAALRVRVSLDRSTAALHAICWECLHDPLTDEPLALNERVVLSRALSSPDLTPLVLPARADLRALVVVASPQNLAHFGLAPIDVAAEVARAAQALAPIPTTVVGDYPGAVAPRATLPVIVEQLRDAPHILYLVCHGSLVGGAAYLWLEQRDGTSDHVPGAELVARIQSLRQRPLLVALASCASAGVGLDSALAALGPQLAHAGVAAVLAMQGALPVATVERLMPSFFRELQRDGQMDRALAAARVALRNDPAWWMPVLFLRSHDGQLWRERLSPAEMRQAVEELRAFLARALSAHQSWLRDMLSLSPPPPAQPYRALLSFTVADAAHFFGRDRAIRTLAEQVMANRLVVLHARSGAGKTSLLQAGLVPALLERRWLPIVVRAGRDPLAALKAALARPSLGPWPQLLSAVALPELLGLLGQQLGRSQNPIVLIFDQFEELFAAQPDAQARLRLASDLATCLADPDLPVHVLISLRGDHLTDLDSLAPALPSILDRRYRLAPMDRDEALTAITQPLDSASPPRSYAPDLLSTLLDDLERMGMELPHLQMICGRLYANLAADERLITLAHYLDLGGAAGILGSYLHQEVGALGRDAELARAVLIALVAPDHTRQRLDAETIRGQLAQRGDLDRLDGLLDRLLTARLIRADSLAGAAAYELAHDYLIDEVLAWVTPSDLAARPVRDALRRALVDWRDQHTVMQPQTLELIHAHREQLSGLSVEELALLLHAAVVHRYAIATWALAADRGGIDIWPLLHPLLASPDHHARAGAVAALAPLGALAIPHLGAALGDPIAPVRAQAIRALALMGSAESDAALRAGLTYERHIPADETAAAFFIDRYPVTNADYAAFLADQPDAPPPASWPSREAPPDRAAHPVVGISWHDAVAFGAWAGKRLPSVAEWQRAAGGPGRPYPWPDRFHADLGNTREARIGATTPVGHYSPAGDSPYGVADMAGNIWEWMADPAGPAGVYRKLRGGAWLYSADFARTSYDGFWLPPDQRQGVTGFRLCLTMPQKEETDV